MGAFSAMSEAMSEAVEKISPAVDKLDATASWLKHNGFVILPPEWKVEEVLASVSDRLAPFGVSVAMQTPLDGVGPVHAILLLCKID